MVLKTKPVVLTVKEKMIIVDGLQKGESVKKLADKYHVGTSTTSYTKSIHFQI